MNKVRTTCQAAHLPPGWNPGLSTSGSHRAGLEDTPLIFGFFFPILIDRFVWCVHFFGVTSWMPSTYFCGLYRAEICEVYSFALISQEASYSNSNWLITFVWNRQKTWLILWGVENLGFPTLWLGSFYFSLFFLAGNSVDSPFISFKDICSSIYRLLAQIHLERDDIKFVEFNNSESIKTRACTQISIFV